jgi:hypothetical protein
MALDNSQKLAIGVLGGAVVLGLALLVMNPDKKKEAKKPAAPPPPAAAAPEPPPPPSGPPPPLQKSQGEDVKDILHNATKRQDPLEAAPR